MWIALAASTPGAASNVVLVAIVSGLGSATLVFAGQMLLRRQQRDSLIASASQQVVDAANALLVDYREELVRAQREIVELRERIAKLESQLKRAQGDVERIETERREALSDLARTQEQVKTLKEKVQALEASTERRRRPEPTTDP